MTKMLPKWIICALLITGPIIQSCKDKPSPIKQQNFDWLLGDWQRTNDKEGQETFESWTKTEKNLYTGIGFTMVDKDTVFFENMQIYKKKEGTWIFDVEHNEEHVPFTMSHVSDSDFITENPENEFPKTISYSKSENGLKAAISDEENEVAFYFEKRTH